MKSKADSLLTKEKIPARQKLEEINKQIIELRAAKAKFQKKYESKKLVSGRDAQFKAQLRNILDFSHPNLEYLYAENVYSPYNIKPKEKYPRETYDIADKVRDLKNKGLKYRDIPPEEKPFDEKVMKKAFIKEVVLYNPSYLAKPKVNDYDLSPYEEVLAKENPGAEYKSVYLKCAEARGGPVKFRLKLKELKAKDALLSASAPAQLFNGDERDSFSAGCQSVADDNNSIFRQESLAPSVQTEMNLRVAQDDNEGDEYFEYADEEDEASTTLKDGETSGFLESQFHGQYMGIYGQNREVGAQVVAWDYNGGVNQMWSLTSEGYLKSHMNDLVLEIAGGVVESGTSVCMGTKNGLLHQKWIFTSTGCIKSQVKGGFVLDVEDLVGDFGSKLIIWTKNGADSQRWKFTHPEAIAASKAAVEEPADEYYDESEFVTTMGDNKYRVAAPIDVAPSDHDDTASIETVEVVKAASVETEVAAEEPADEYYDDNEFVSTMGSNKNQAAAPIDATSSDREDTTPLETAEVEQAAPVETEGATEEPADEYYDDSEFMSTLGSNNNQEAAPIDATPAVREDTLSIETVEPNPIPPPADEDAQLLSPTYEDDYASPESSPVKLSATEPTGSFSDGKSAAGEDEDEALFHRTESSTEAPIGGGGFADDASYGSEQYYEEDYEMDSTSNTLRLTKGSRKASSGNMLPATAETSDVDQGSSSGTSIEKVIDLPTSNDNEESSHQFKRESSDLSSAESVLPISSAALLLNLHTNKVLDINGQNNELGAEVVLESYKGGLSQLWSFTSEGYLESHLNGLVLDIAGGMTECGAALCLGAKNGSQSQKWILTPEGCLQSQADFVLDIENLDNNFGEKLILGKKNELASQRWKFSTPLNFESNHSSIDSGRTGLAEEVSTSQQSGVATLTESIEVGSTASGAKVDDDEDQYLVDFDDCQSSEKTKSGNLNVNVSETYHSSDILEDSIDNSQNQINTSHPLGDVSLVGESPSRIDQIDYNMVAGSSSCDSPGVLQRTGTVKDNYLVPAEPQVDDEDDGLYNIDEDD